MPPTFRKPIIAANWKMNNPPAETEKFLELKGAVRMSRYGGDCYAYCLLAAGYVDVIVETLQRIRQTAVPLGA